MASSRPSPLRRVAVVVAALVAGHARAEAPAPAAAPAAPNAAPAPQAPAAPAPGDGQPTLGTPPRLVGQAPLQLPPGTRFPAPEVTVVMRIDVAADGRVEDVGLVQGAGEPFDGAALAAARQYVFEPGRLTTGEAVPVSISYQLRIREPPPPPPPPVRFTGRLLERGTREPLAGAVVTAEAGDRVLARATSGPDGRFTLEVPEAAFDVAAAVPDHERARVHVDAKPGEQRDETLYLLPLPTGTSAVVRGERVRREITRQVIPAEEVALLPGSQGDTLKAVLNLPGVARQPALGGQLVLRGSAPGDSAAFVEGLEIPTLYHFGVLRSTFAPRFLDSIEFVPGNFAPDYGRLTGGIVNARVRDPSTDLFHGEVDLNVYDGGVAAEGPLSDTWAVGGAFRRSWIDVVLPLFLPSDSAVSFTTLPRFYDYQFIATHRPSERDRVRILFFGSQDKLAAVLSRPTNDPTIGGDFFARLAYHELQVSWMHVFSPALRHESYVSAGLQDTQFQIGQGLYLDLGVKVLGARSTWTWDVDPGRLQLRAGLDAASYRYDVSLDAPLAPTEGQPPLPVSTQRKEKTEQAGWIHQPAAFVEVGLTPVEGLTILPSLRVDYESAIQRASLDPRLSVRWGVGPFTTLKAAAGVYHQAPSANQSAAEVGNPNLEFVRSIQVSGGVEQKIVDGIDLDTTAFYKDLDDLVVQNPAWRGGIVPGAVPYVNEGTGRIYGLELLLRARYGEKFFGWVAYTFQRAYRTDHPGQAERLFSFDQPHILTVLGTWKPNARWAFGARFRLVSGNPYTPVTGSIYYANGDVYVPLYGAINSERLGTFTQLDLRVDRFWIYDRWKLSAYLDVQNVYNRQNQEGWSYSFDYRYRTELTGLPIIPILGAKAEW